VLRRLALALLAVALFAGWQEALLHPLEHFDEHGEFVHVAHSHSDPQQNETSSDPSDKLCSALAALTACAPEAPAWGFDPNFSDVTFLSQYGPLRVAEAPPFLAQGPPALL
jgi:hypothetical protein